MSCVSCTDGWILYLPPGKPKLIVGTCIIQICKEILKGVEESELGSSGSITKHRDWVLQKQKWSLEFWRSKVLVAQVLVRAVFLAADGCLLPVSSQGRKRKHVLWSLFRESADRSTRSHPRGLIELS